MSLGWTDGNTFIPVNSTLLASSKKENILGIQKEYDGLPLLVEDVNLHKQKVQRLC